MSNDDDLDPDVFQGAAFGARAGLHVCGIEADDQICSQVAMAVLTGFTLSGGLEPESLERLRDMVVSAVSAPRN